MHGNGGAAMSAAADVRPALIGHLKDLHLPTVRECYEDTARRAERETLSYEQYLLDVISRECEQRRKSRVQRLLKDSALPLEKSLQNFDLKRLPAKAARQLKTLLEGGFLDRKENVLVFGNPGSGKSHLLTALAQELVVVRERKFISPSARCLLKTSSPTASAASSGKRFRARHRPPGLFDTRCSHTRLSGGNSAPNTPCTTCCTATDRVPRPSSRCHIINQTTTASL